MFESHRLRPIPYDAGKLWMRRLARNLSHVYGDNTDPDNMAEDGQNYGELTKEHVLQEAQRYADIYDSTDRLSRPIEGYRRRTKFTDDEVLDITCSYLSGRESINQLAHRFSSSPRSVSNVTSRQFAYDNPTILPDFNLLSDGEIDVYIEYIKEVRDTRRT